MKEETALADHFRQRLRIGPIGSGLARSDCSWCRIERDQDVGVRLDQREAAREGLPRWSEGRGVCAIEDEDARPQRQRPELAYVVGHAQSFDVSCTRVASTGTKKFSPLICRP